MSETIFLKDESRIFSLYLFFCFLKKYPVQYTRFVDLQHFFFSFIIMSLVINNVTKEHKIYTDMVGLAKEMKI
jgi:hypothetical protein